MFFLEDFFSVVSGHFVFFFSCFCPSGCGFLPERNAQQFHGLCALRPLVSKDAKTTPIGLWSVPMHFGGSNLEPSSNLALGQDLIMLKIDKLARNQLLCNSAFGVHVFPVLFCALPSVSTATRSC